jgi:subtilisin family serine protease
MVWATTHTPGFLGLPQGAWRLRKGSVQSAGRGVVVGILDTGIDPRHPSFSSPRPTPREFISKCAVTARFPPGSCNAKLVIARHFSRGIAAANAFNSSYDIDSPLDGNGHGT